MKCPFCGNMENKVIDSRLSKDGQVIRRRRECNDCSKRFTTYERIEEVLPQVVRSDERREPFDHARLVQSVQQACEKRTVPVETIEQMIEDIEKQLQETGEKEVSSGEIRDEVLVRLADVDDVAYLRYAALYGDFDLEGFAAELEQRLTERRQRTKSPSTP